MLETSGLSQRTLRQPHKSNVLKEIGKKNFLGQHPSEQRARNIVASGFRHIRRNPISNSIFVEQRKKQLETEKVRQDLEQISIIDSLTGMYNRRFLDGNPEATPPRKGILEREVERILRDNKELAVAMLDIDHFKEVNDQYGHPIGDEILKKVTQIVLKNIRFDLDDFAIRIGGDEFLIVTPNGLDVAQKMIERIRREIEETSFNSDKHPKNITISCGLTNLAEKGSAGSYKEIAEAMINRADAALYESKRKDRNQITVAVQNGVGETEFKKIFLEK